MVSFWLSKMSYAFNPFDCYSQVACLLVASLLAFFLLLDRNNRNSNACESRVDGRSSRPVGLLEQGLLATAEKRRRAMITSCLLLKSRVRLAPQMVKEALILLSKRYPLLRMKMTMESRNGEPVTEHFTEVEVNQSNVPLKVLEVISADDIVPVFESESDSPFNFNIGPLWRAILLKETRVVEEDLYKSTIMFTFHHVITDGRSIIVMLEQLLSYLRWLYDGQDVTVESLPLRPSTGYLMRRSCTPTFFDKMLYSVTGFMKRLRAMVMVQSNPTNLYLARYPAVFTRNPAAPDKTSVVYRKVSFNEGSVIFKKCKLLGCSVHGAITAAAHIAMATILQRANTKTPENSFCIKSGCNVDLRKECQPEIKKEEFVLCVSNFHTETTASPFIKDFWKFAQECMRCLRWAFITGQHHKFLKQCHLKLSNRRKQSAATENQQDLRLFNLSNLGRYEWSAEPEEEPFRVTGVVGMVSVQPSAPVFSLLTGTINGVSYWTNSYNTRLVTREQAEAFLDLTLEILKDASQN